LKKLYVKNDDGSFEEVSALLASPHLKPIVKTTIKDAFSKYIKNCTSQKNKSNQNSEKLYFKILGDFLVDDGLIHIDQVAREHIDRFEARLLKKMKVSSVVRRFCTIKHFFNKCVEWNLITESPCKDIKRRKVEKNPFKPWTQEIFDKFIKESDSEFKPIFEFLWMTGCRPIEAKNLRWTDVDFESQILTFKCGKNSAIRRKFPITKKLDQFLHCINMQGSHVFHQFNADNLYHHCKKRMNRLGLKNYTVYGLRHGFGTRLAKQGVNSFYIAELMGHSDLKTTRGYVHFEKNLLIQILNKAN
jgi:integrase